MRLNKPSHLPAISLNLLRLTPHSEGEYFQGNKGDKELGEECEDQGQGRER